MSSVTSRSTPISLAMCLAAMTPPVGPETAIWIGVSAAASNDISPPLDRITTTWSVMPRSVRRPRSVFR